MNPRHLGCLLIIAAVVGLGVKLWHDFGPDLELPEVATESPRPERSEAREPSEDPGDSPSPDADRNERRSERGRTIPAGVTSWWAVFHSDPGCGLREADRVTSKELEVQLLATDEEPPPGQKEETRGFTAAEFKKLQGATSVSVLYAPARPGNLEQVFLAQKAAGSIARACAGYPYDPDLNLAFTAELWEREVMGSWDGEDDYALPRATNHFATRDRDRDGQKELTTQGLRRFGIPEIQITTSQKLRPVAARLLDLAAQTVIERGDVAALNEVDIEGIEHAEAREQYEREAASDAELLAGISWTVVTESPWPVVELSADDAEQLAEVDRALFGKRSTRVAAIKASGGKARAQLMTEVLPRFKKGLKANEGLFVMDAEGQWLRADRWTGTRFAGAAADDPIGSPAFELDPKKAVDFALLHEDGTWDGTRTGVRISNR